MTRCDSSTRILARLAVIAALALAGCGSDGVTADGSGDDDGSDKDECTTDNTCDSFLVYCNDGDEVPVAGCRTDDGCRTQSELPASLCGEDGFDTVETVAEDPDDGDDDADDTAMSMSDPNGFAIGGHKSCRDNQLIYSYPNGNETVVDCTNNHQLCKADATGEVDCREPELSDECGEGTIACSSDGHGVICENHAYVEIDDFKLECQWDQFSSTGDSNTLFCGDLRRYSVEGSYCNVDGASCAPDLGAVHVCRDNEWVVSQHCDPGACQVYTDEKTLVGTVRCSYGGYAVGDDCDFEGGNVACSGDRTKLLNCVAGRTAVKQTCSAGQECRRGTNADGGVILHCAAEGYAVDDLCHFEDAVLCSGDERSVLVCHDGRMELDTMCDEGKTCQTVVESGVPIGKCK